MDRIIIPIHLGNHWCLAVINIQDRLARLHLLQVLFCLYLRSCCRRFEYYDSLGSPNPTCLKRLRQYLQDEAQDKKGIKLDLLDWTDYQPREIPMQRNGYDCGVFACKFAECIASGRPFYFSQVGRASSLPPSLPWSVKMLTSTTIARWICHSTGSG